MSDYTLFIIFFVQLIVILLAASFVGLSIAKLLPYRLWPIGRLYFSPLFGISIFVIVAVLNGWIAPFNQIISIIELLILVGISFFVLRSDLKLRPLIKSALFLALFSLLASVAISSSLIRFNSFSTFDDAFTYLVHSQWLQNNAFSQAVKSSAFYPALSQVNVYQELAARMGGSFFFGWMQSIFGLRWSYSAYPVVVAIPLVVCSLAIGGAVNLLVRGSRKIALLTALAAASMFSGLTFGVTHGFLPQAFGIAFTVGGLSLLAAVINENRKVTQRKKLFIGAIPISILFAALVFCYSDMVPFVVISSAVFLIFTLVFDRSNIKAILLTNVIVFSQIIILINVDLFRFINAAQKIFLKIGTAKMVVGYPVTLRPFELLAFSYGFRSFDNWMFIDWIFGKVVTPVIFAVLFGAIIYYVFLMFKKKSTIYLLPHISILFVALIGILYFRYFTKPFFPNDVGQAFLQFKLTKWVSPYSFILMGSALAYYSKKYGTKVLAVFLGFLVIFSVFSHLSIYPNITQAFHSEIGYNHSSFNAFLNLRKKIEHIDKKEVIYINLGPDHVKLRELIAYFLLDRKLASDYTDGGYIGGSRMPIDLADWIIEFDDSNPGRKDPVAGTGNMILRKANEVIPFSKTAINTGYGRETDGTNWWYWTSHFLIFKYKALTNNIQDKKIIMKFTYQSALPDETLRIKIAGKEEIKLKMTQKPNEFVSKPIHVNYKKFLLKFESNGKTVRASKEDPRQMSFLIKNLELINIR